MLINQVFTGFLMFLVRHKRRFDKEKVLWFILYKNTEFIFVHSCRCSCTWKFLYPGAFFSRHFCMPAHDESRLLRIRFQHGAFPHFPAFFEKFFRIVFCFWKSSRQSYRPALSRKLKAGHSFKNSFFVKKLIRYAMFRNNAARQNDDFILTGNRSHSVCDNKDRFVFL